MNGEALVLLEEALAAGKTVTIRGTGRSMLPFIPPGREVFVARLTPFRVRIGDVVLTRRGDVGVLHRVHRVRANGSVITKGDFSPHYDREIGPDAVLGKIVAPPVHDRLFAPVAVGLTRLHHLAPRAWRRLVLAFFS